jgi:hypothetical protein
MENERVKLRQVPAPGATARDCGWDENRVFLEDDKLEVAVKNGRWAMTVVILAAVLVAGFLGLAVPRHMLNTLGLAAADCDNC